MLRRACEIGLLAWLVLSCASDDPDPTPARAPTVMLPVPVVARAPSTGGATIYLNRRGATLTPGYDDAARGVSSIVAATAHARVVLPPFAGSDEQWSRFAACVAAEFAPFGGRVVDERPAAPPYVMAVVGGDATLLGFPAATGGAAPIDALACGTIPDAVVFVFSDALGPDVEGLCEVAAQEISHAFSLDHELLADDPMSYLPFAGHKTFQDRDAPCGEYALRPCICGRPSQRSTTLLRERLAP